MRSLLITGATGMIGSAIVREAIKDGFDIQEALTPKETLEEICKELGLI